MATILSRFGANTLVSPAANPKQDNHEEEMWGAMRCNAAQDSATQATVLHVWISGTAAALGRDPDDVLRRVL
ncbi:MAG TPA: hypothetical protein VN019_09125, partial [Oxalicibacterium sp.]|nr:hypothetical protein [Oxalicibacterium sp.]